MNKNILSKFTALLMLTTSVVMGGPPALDVEKTCFAICITNDGKPKGVEIFPIGAGPDITLFQLVEKSGNQSGYTFNSDSGITLYEVKRTDGKFTPATDADIAAVWAKVREQEPSYVLPGENPNNLSNLPLRLAGFLGGPPRSKNNSTVVTSRVSYILGADMAMEQWYREQALLLLNAI